MSAYIIGILLISGGFFAVVAGLGILRLPDVLVRMHASTKAGTLACGLIMLAAIFYFGDLASVFRAALIVGFLMLTAPVAAHMIGRAAMRTGAAPDTRDFTKTPKD